MVLPARSLLSTVICAARADEPQRSAIDNKAPCRTGQCIRNSAFERATRLANSLIAEITTARDAAKIDSMTAGDLLGEIAKVTGRSKGEIRQAAEKAPRTKSANDDAPIRRDKDGSVRFRYSAPASAYDLLDALKVVRMVTLEQNLDALKRPWPNYTARLESLVRLNDSDGEIQFVPLKADQFRGRLNKRLTFQAISEDTGDGPRKAVPKEVVETFYHTADDDLPPTPDYHRAPFYTSDGKLILEDGWHMDVNVLLHSNRLDVGDVPEVPTEEQVTHALRLLRTDVLGEFPFLDRDEAGVERREASEANALAYIITPFVRLMIRGVVPIFFFAKPAPGTGATLLANCGQMIADGDVAEPMAYNHSEEEARKALVSALLENRRFLFYDDVKEFNNRVIKQSVTSRKVGGRILGLSANVMKTNTYIWCATGNNPPMDNEMERRICWIWLNARIADIQNRKFSRPDLLEWVQEHRGKIVNAILTLVQHWIATGSPLFKTRGLQGFGPWAEVVGGIIDCAWPEHAFLDNRRRAVADPDFAAMRQFVVALWAKYGLNATLSTDVVVWATGLAGDGLDILAGRPDHQWKSQILNRLMAADGQTFQVGDDALMIRGTTIKDAPGYELVKVVPDGAADVG